MSFLSQLKLTAISFNGEALSPDTTFCEFSVNEKITLGRSGSNNLVLDDPSRVISRLQARLSPKDSLSVHIVNLSASTSMFINAQQLLPGESSVLSCNDSLMVGAYVIQLSADNIMENKSVAPTLKSVEHLSAVPGFIPEDIDFLNSENNTYTSDSVLSKHHSSEFFTETGVLQSDNKFTDFLFDQLLGKKSAPDLATDDESGGATVGTTLDVLSDSLNSLLSEKKESLPSSLGQDHSLEIESLFVVPRPMSTKTVDSEALAAMPVNDSFPVVSSVAVSQAVPRQSTVSAEIGLNEVDECRLALSRALQMDIHKLPAFTPAFFEQLGGVLLHLTAGIVNMMHGRAQVKHEMRADVTIIAASGNNPLKFAPDAQSAIEHLLGEPMPGFLRSREAIDDAVNDLLAHQVGLVSGARAAVYEVMKNFSPEKMQKYLATKNIIDSLLPMAKRARLWELYEVHYAEVAGSAREEFELRFQQAFAQAYELEIDKMCMAREAV